VALPPRGCIEGSATEAPNPATFSFSSTGASLFATTSLQTFVSRRRSNAEPTPPRFAAAFAESMREASSAESAGPIAERAGFFAEIAGCVASPLDPTKELAGSIQKS
jgi:hypothetical protein